MIDRARSIAADRAGSLYLDGKVEDIEAFKESIEAELVEQEWVDDIGEFVLMREPNGNFIEVLEPRG